MAYSTVPKVRRDGTITLLDSGGTNSLVIAYEEGNLTFDLTKADQTVIRDRGTITTVRKGDDQPITSGSFSAFMRQFTSSTAGSLLDFVNKTGSYSSNTSVAGDGSGRNVFIEHYAIDIQFGVAGTAFGDDDGDHQALIKSAVCTVSFAEGDPSSFTISFTAYEEVAFS